MYACVQRCVSATAFVCQAPQTHLITDQLLMVIHSCETHWVIWYHQALPEDLFGLVSQPALVHQEVEFQRLYACCNFKGGCPVVIRASLWHKFVGGESSESSHWIWPFLIIAIEVAQTLLTGCHLECVYAGLFYWVMWSKSRTLRIPAKISSMG